MFTTTSLNVIKIPNSAHDNLPAAVTTLANPVSPNLNQAVALTIRQLRKKRGLSQEELAQKASVDRTYISGIERARRNITVGTLERLIPHLASDSHDFFMALCSQLKPSESTTPSR